jgi:hypothetical protein
MRKIRVDIRTCLHIYRASSGKHLLSKYEALSSNPNTIRKKKKRKKQFGPGCSSAVECLPSTRETLGSIPRTEEENKSSLLGMILFLGI